MQVHYNIDRLPAFHQAVITIGAFDGVHLGHRQILQQLIDTAKAVNGTDVVITFYPHPKKVVGSSNYQIRLLNTLEEKIALLSQFGLSHLVVVPFSADFAGMEAEKYITHFLVKHFHPHTIITGYDHRFGNNRTGDIGLLRQLADNYQYRVIEIPEFLIQDNNISSTKIREALTAGHIEKATALLGYPYSFSGTVIAGDKIGRTIGYPTANIQPDNEEKLIPGAGVYAVKAKLLRNGQILSGMMNIGNRPTFDGISTRIEVHLFDFDEQLYGEMMQIIPFQKIREERKFQSMEALKTQLQQDEATVKKIIAH